MRVIRTTDSKENLCDKCPKRMNFPVCVPGDIEFGNGIGDDNIVACSQCVVDMSKSETAYYGEISKLPRKRQEEE